MIPLYGSYSENLLMNTTSRSIYSKLFLKKTQRVKAKT